MCGLLVHGVRAEVDFEEAAIEVTNIFNKWSKSEHAGTRAFIPHTKDRNECYVALRIHVCALEEARLIPIE